MTLMIDFPFPGTAAWVEHFKEVELPILRLTSTRLAELRDSADVINTRELANIIVHDPLMTLRIFRFMKENRSRSQNAEITTIERSLMMIGTQRFYDSCQDLPIIEHQLKGYPKAMLGLLKVIARSRQASIWARDWALLRQNTRFEEISLAALLHDFVEILMHCFAPNLATTVRERLASHPSLRTRAVQEEVFGAPPQEIMRELIGLWGLPELLLSLLDPADADIANVRNVNLAVDLARHTATGWQNPALQDDLPAISELVHLDRGNLLERLGAPEEMVLAARATEGG
ncbi:HDOD domain-containing protein [Azonexus caeni]|jgi:HD-like signal output (HDOD) protein|uniref:HDOD domain-containing protein n=1 Tax=Azonexus caeni TaxID=266126 RepID=UPI003A891F66